MCGTLTHLRVAFSGSLRRLCLAVARVDLFCLGVWRMRRGGELRNDTFTGAVLWSLPRLCLAAVRVDVFCLGVQRVRRGGVCKSDTFTGTVFW